MKLLLLCVPYDGGKSGVSVYIRNVVRELKQSGHDLTLIVEENAVEDFKDYELIVLPKCCNSSFISSIYCLYFLHFQVRSKNYDRLIITAGNRRFCLGFKCEVYAVVHDLSQFHIENKYDFFRMLYVMKLLPYYLRNGADHVFAVSRSTADDLVKYWHIPAGKISVNYNGINRRNLPLGENDAVEKSVLYVSRIEVPGKNHLNLIKAWNLMPPELAKEYKLLIAGADWSGAEAVHQLAAKSPYKENIEFLGFISLEQLQHLYKHSTIYVFPSFFEGFGLSLIEAMASGLVCCCSNNSSLGEIAADAALTFAPGRVEEIAGAMTKLLTDETLRLQLRERGLKREKEFDWGKHAVRLLETPENYAELFGVKFSTGDMANALAELDKMIQDGKKHFCAFVNADCFNQAYTNVEYRQVLADADVVWADGVGADIAARHLHTPVRGNVNGTDMLPFLCRKGYRIYLLGAAPQVAEEAGKKLLAEYPNCRIVGTQDGYFPESATDEIISRINQAGPDILLVAFGVPRQEFWIAKNLPRLQCKVAIGVGGLLDFASGRIPRAPQWLRKMRLEWMYRLYNEPIRLFNRYVIGNPLFLYRVFFRSQKYRLK